MFKKMTSLRAPVEQVQEVFKDIESWPQWMPDIRQVRVLEQTEHRARVDMRTVMLGMSFDQTVEFHLQPGRVTQKQLAGRFKKWEAEWRFWSSEEGNATILSAAFDIDFGFLGMFVSERIVANALNDWFGRLAVKAEERVRKQSALRPTAAPAQLRPSPARPSPAHPAPAPSTETLLQVFQTEVGLEVWIQQQRFFIPVSPGGSRNKG